ncbi:uncharacterized protein LTR77_004448 [Saxophila tyrrhenica]|uniref:DUF7732 domain-containing protein n=1 Tax=Saxophila tyrrhenica TaxID=1690608 RepID=A0AAV9PCR1_9PEZI|nr:hypothetical protein LTR77_004448 [Saxophila tyrrhenica]
MRASQAIFLLLTLVTSIHAFALPDAFDASGEKFSDLWKRRGGGGGRGGGGFSSGGGRSSGGSSGGRPPSTRGNSNTGGRTSGGSGPQPRSYPSGNYYGGGARVPYRAGGRSPGGVAPVFLGAGALAFFPGIWLYGAYRYNYDGEYDYHNRTSGRNESRPVECLCGRYQECGCNQNNNFDYLTAVANNNSISRVANVDGEQTLVINGTLPNGTTVDSAAGSYRQNLAEMSGYWVAAGIVVYAVWFI